MPKAKQPYSVYKRPTKRKGRFVYYIQFRDRDGDYLSGVSSGQSSRSAARTWATEQLRRGAIPLRQSLTFGEFAESWWTDSHDYVRARRARGVNISPGYLAAMRTYLVRHLLPEFGRKRVVAFTTPLIDTWLINLYEAGHLSPTTINHVLRCLKIMMKEALRLGYVAIDPAAAVSQLKEERREKSVLETDEVKQLLGGTALSDIWSGESKYYAINLLAASTGMRMGECQGLQVQHVHEDHIAVTHSWARQHGLREPKWNSSRLIPIPERTSELLRSVIEHHESAEPEDLVFQGSGAQKPIDHKRIGTMLYRAMENIGINEEERRTRNVSFHSWRHWFNSVCRTNGVPDAKLRRVIGHRTEAMTELYSHFRLEDFHEVASVQERVFPTPSTAAVE